MHRLALVLAALLATLLAAAPAHALDRDELRAALARELRAAGPGAGAYARDLRTGRTLFAARADRTRVPASVDKLFVTSTALLRLGADGTLATRVFASAPPAKGTIAGDLYLVGGGDGTLSPAGLASLARTLRAAGVRAVQGTVVGDESFFDTLRGTASSGFRPGYWIGGSLGALTVGRGFPGSPAGTTAVTFARALRAAGVRVRVGGARAGTRPPAAVAEIARLPSPPMGALAAAINTPSDNFLAETLIKALGATFGARGSTYEGAAVVRATLRPLGVRPRVVDGSGLSRANRTSPRHVVRLLDRMADRPEGPALRASLAVTGRTGTVARRMRGTPASGRCSVKTGTLISVSSLAGVCTTRGGDVAFAWLMNGVWPVTARRVQDRMTALIARYEGAAGE